MQTNKITFALYFGNRGFFPGEFIKDARDEMKKAVLSMGFDYICMEEDKTKFGAVETIEEGKLYAEFLKQNEGKYQGIIICLPNFGDENGAQAALKNACVPILIQAYPDEIGKMDFAHRRDAMCGKFAMCNVLRQMNIPFSLTKKFVVSPSDESFKKDLERFGAICRVTRGMKGFSVGAIGARTTAFKTVRYDESAFEKSGITVEAIDLSEVFSVMRAQSEDKINAAKEKILAIASFSGYPDEKLENMARIHAAMEEIVKKYDLSAVAVRCWNEFETEFKVAPCTSLCILNEDGICAACEVDVVNAVMMRALSLAANNPCTLLDLNNNYGAAEDKAIMFHCGPCAVSMLEGKGTIIEHLMFKKCFGEGSGVGVNKGKLKSGEITFGSLKTENGRISAFVSDGEFTSDEIEEAFFGTGKVCKKENFYDICGFMALSGYKHHICVTYGNVKEAVAEAFEKYLGIDIKVF